jgi:hypothetical protein
MQFIGEIGQNNLEYAKNNHRIFDKNFLNDCFLVACSKNFNLDVIKHLINVFKIDINYVDNYGDSGFTLACSNNHNLGIIRYLVDVLKMSTTHVNINDDNGFTLACWKNSQLDVIRYLANELKMNIKHTNKLGNNGLLLACMNNPNPDVIKYLVDTLKMDTRITNNFNLTCFMSACYSHPPNLNVVRYLSEHTNVEQNLSHLPFDAFKNMIVNYHINNYPRFNDLFDKGLSTYGNNIMGMGYSLYYYNGFDVILKTINHLVLSKSIIKKMGLTNPFDNKFKEFVKKFDQLTDDVKNYYVCTIE